MSKFATLLALLVAALACGFFATPALAQRARVFVASYGSDSNPCTFGSPCKTFQHAHDVVADSGEITAIDSAGFGPVTITKGVTITSPNGVEAGIVAGAGDTAITINARTSDAVILRGLTLQGGNSANYGIAASQAGKIEIIDCVVRDFSQVGIYISHVGTTPLLVHISNTRVMNNAVTGIAITSINGGNVIADFDHLTVIDNNQYGISVGAFLDALVKNSDVSNNGRNSNGCNIEINGIGTGFSTVTARNVTFNQQYSTTGSLKCSINLDGDDTLFLSENMGGFVMQNPDYAASSAIFSDGTNTMVIPSSVIESDSGWVRN
jgi:hypothetical protein